MSFWRNALFIKSRHNWCRLTIARSILRRTLQGRTFVRKISLQDTFRNIGKNRIYLEWTSRAPVPTLFALILLCIFSVFIWASIQKDLMKRIFVHSYWVVLFEAYVREPCVYFVRKNILVLPILLTHKIELSSLMQLYEDVSEV